MNFNNQPLIQEFNQSYEPITNEIWMQVLNSGNAHSALIKSAKTPEVARLLNTIQFMQLSGLDIMVIIKGLLNSKNYFELLFYVRNAGTILTQFNEDRLGIAGKDFQTLLPEVGVTDEEIVQLNQIRKKLTSVLKHHETSFREIRNTLHSHRKHDTLAQLELLQTLNPLEVKKILDSVLQWINEINSFLISILSRRLKSGQ